MPFSYINSLDGRRRLFGLLPSLIKEMKMLNDKLPIKKLKEIKIKDIDFSKMKFDVKKYIETSYPEVDKILRQININASKSFKKELNRKAIHLSSLWIPALIYFVPKYWAIALFAFLLFGDIVLEYANYRRCKWARKTFGSLFFKVMRNKETSKTHFEFSGSVFVLCGALLSTLLFPIQMVVVGLTIMLISDTLAALVGKFFGTRKIYKEKSVEGTMAFFVSSILVCLLYEPILSVNYATIVACICVTFAELYESRIKIDDNLSIPLIFCLIMNFLS